MATIFKSDAQGFILGEKLLDNSQELLRVQSSAMPVWRAIRNDVRSIARQLGVQVSRANSSAQRGASMAAGQPAGRRTSSASSAPLAPAAQRQRAVGQPAGLPQRDARGRFISKPIAAAVDEAMRDKRGRFTTGGSKPGDDAPGRAPGDPSSRNLAALSERLDKIGAGLAGSTENIDPTLNAAKEVKDAVAPLGRGLGGLFGRNAERKKERWYQRIWQALTARNKADKTATATPRSGGIGFMSNLGGMAGGVLGTAGGLLKRGGALAGGLLRRLPILGALFSGGMSLAGAMGMNDDPTKSPEENRAMRYRSSGQAAGMGAGGLIGGVLGSLLGPLGTVGGAWLGSLVGEKIGGALGGWTKELVDAKVPDKIVAYVGAAWDSISADMKSTWSTITSKVGAWVDGTKDALSGANKWVKDKTGVDVAGTAKSAWDATKSAVSTTAGAAMDFAKANAEKMVPETVKRAASAGSNAVSSMLGISKVVEAGAGYNVVQRGDGSVVRQEGARNWRNNNPGNIEYGEFARRNGAIGSDGRFAIFPTFEAGRAAQEALFFEGKNYKNLKLSDAVARWAPPGENNTRAYQAAVLATVGGQDKPTGDYSPAERRAIMDAKQKVEGYKVGTVTPSSVFRVASSVVAPPVPMPARVAMPMLSAADIPKAPEVKEPPIRLNSDRGEPLPVTVRIPESLCQDVGDRSLAHIVSGGISAM